MIWLNKYKRIWRTAVLGLFLLGFLGPWTYESTYLPMEATCPGILLENGNCGLTIPGIFILLTLAIYPSSIVSTLKGDSQFYLLIILSLNIVLTLLSLSCIKRISRVLPICWSIAMVAGLYLTVSGNSRIHLALWGVWLSFGLAVIMVILEFFLWVRLSKDHAYGLD